MLDDIHQAALGPACTTIRNAINDAMYCDSPRRSLTGKWLQKWMAPHSRNYDEENESAAMVRQVGNRFFATCDDRGQPFRLKGEIQGRFITGTWGDKDQGFYYYGAFQFHISPRGDKLVGKYVGFKSENTVASGDWIWTREA